MNGLSANDRPDEFDLIVLGAGPAGEKGAAQAAYFGKKVALVEERDVGGALTNEATVLSKTLRETALHAHNLRQRKPLDGNASVLDLTPEELFFRERNVVDAHRELVRANIERHGIELVRGRGSLLDENTVLVESDEGGPRTISGRFVLLATGSRPHRPDDVPLDEEFVFDSNSILKIERLPASLTVVGAGVIGVEYATLFAALGVEVSLVDQSAEPLPFLDREVRDLLVARMKGAMSGVVFGQAVSEIRVLGDSHRVIVRLADGSEIVSEAVLYCGGRLGNTEGLGLERLAVKTDARGRVQVNDCYQTAVASVYAAGDVIGFPALAATSMEQGRVAVCQMFGFDYKKQVSALVPYGIYTVPEVSMVGETEESLQREGREYLAGRAWYRTNPKAQILGDTDGLVKILFDPRTRLLLGVHIIGERATELVHLGQMCMHLGGTLDYFIQAVFNFPTLSDAFKYAAYDGLGRLARSPGSAPTNA